MSITSAPFGVLPTGEKVTRYTLTNARGASVSILDLGGIITSIVVPGKDGQLVDVLLGSDELSSYVGMEGYLGALIGRSGNRFGDGKARLNGKVLQLAKNDHGKHHLHGGDVGFDRKVWTAKPLGSSLELRCVSPDGEENYPGTLNVLVTYTWSDANALSIRYEAVSDKDTLCNLTNHAYFNLDGAGTGTVENLEIQINADRLTVVSSADCIPTGELRDVTGSAFDLRQPKRIGDGLAMEAECEQMTFGGGYDHNFALNGSGTREIAKLYSPKTGIEMNVTTDLPGVQFYTGNFLNGSFVGKGGVKYEKRFGLCLETQFYPDSPNHDEFEPCVLKAGDKYDTTTTYQFSVR